MAADSELDRSRAVVKTYVPAYQKDEWARHADKLGMSQSEFVRTMVQAGRQGFGATFDGSTDESSTESASDDIPKDAQGLEVRVRELLAADEHRSWDDLLEELSGGFEERLETALKSMEDAGVIEHSPRKGGYTLAEVDER